MFKYIIWAIIFYMLIRFVFNFLIPVIRASRQMRQQMRSFQDKMNQQHQFRENQQEHEPDRSRRNDTAKKGDYIDFEEVK